MFITDDNEVQDLEGNVISRPKVDAPKNPNPPQAQDAAAACPCSCSHALPACRSEYVDRVPYQPVWPQTAGARAWCCYTGSCRP